MEGKKDIKIDEKKGNLILENRKKLSITGVIEVISFDDEKIILNTNHGGLNIKGNSLKMNKLDVQNGDVVIIGNINSCVYTGAEARKDNDSIIKRLFK